MFKSEDVQLSSELLQEEYTLSFWVSPTHQGKAYCLLLGNLYKYPLSLGVQD